MLNLRRVRRLKSADPDYAAHPVFENPALNGAIIVKHRLRPNELSEFASVRRSATKILLPIESNELRLGARYVFIGQRCMDELLHDSFGIALSRDSHDKRTLAILDKTPTLDPFLLREIFRLGGMEPARCYFDLSQADTRRVFEFAQREIEPLVRMTVGEGPAANAFAVKLTSKILANAADVDLDPLRRTMQMEVAQFQEGVFCWKAFLYYKWQLAELLPKVAPVIKEIQTVKPHGPQSADTKAYLEIARTRLHKAIIAACRSVKSSIAVYDSAYERMTLQSEPLAFRDFLLRAPQMFNELGERLGAVEHIVSYWRFKFGSRQGELITPEDLTDIFKDFEGSIEGVDDAADKPQLATPEIINAR